MLCPACASPLPLNVRFCPQCGTRIGVCAGCGEIIAGPDRICRQCGTTRLQVLDRPSSASDLPLPPERKRITVLFADLVGSTALVDGQDPELVYDLYNQSLRQMSEAIVRWEGTVGSLMGDGLMAFFGAPISREDDALRAALAALGIVEMLSGQEGPTGQRLHVRVGLDTGNVLLASLGMEGQSIYTAVGETVSIAARLETLAEPDTVVASEATWSHLAPHFEGISLGQLQVRGKQDPVSAWRVIRRRPRPNNERGLPGMRAPLIGRDVEREALQARLDALALRDNRAGGLALVIGEPGIGKSRLISEVTAPYRTSGITMLEGRCLSYTEDEPYAPWLHLLRSWFGGEGDDEQRAAERLKHALSSLLDPATLARHAPFLESLLSLPLSDSDRNMIGQLSPASWGLRVRQALVVWAEAVTARRSLLIYFEDLHWSDPTSLLAIEAMLDISLSNPLLIFAATRSDMSPELLALRQRARSRLGTQMTEHQLGPLDDAQSHALIHSLLQGKAPTALTDLVTNRADGNPFFIEELLRVMIDGGRLVRGPEGWQLTRRTEQLPSSLQALLNARMDRLSYRQKSVLQSASVIGRVFGQRLLAQMGHDLNTLASDLYDLCQQNLIRRYGWSDLWETEYIFRHALTQEAVYASIPHRDRARYHRQVAESMEPLLSATATEGIVLLATHWESAGHAEIACSYLQRAAEVATNRYANEEAEALYSRALKLAVSLNARFDLLERRHQLYDRLGRREERQGDIAEMMALADEMQDQERQLRTRAYAYIDSIQRGEARPLPHDEEDQLVAGLIAHGDELLALDLLELLVVRYWTSYSFPLDRQRARTLQQQVLALTQRLGVTERYLLNVAVEAEQRDDVEGAIEALQNVLYLAVPWNDMRISYFSHHRLGRLLAHRDGPTSFQHHLRSIEIAQQMSDSRLELVGSDNAAEVAARIGDYESAVRLWGHCLVLQHQRQQGVEERHRLTARYAFALYRAGRFEEALALITAEGDLTEQSAVLLQLELTRVEIELERGHCQAALSGIRHVEQVKQAATYLTSDLEGRATFCLLALIRARYAMQCGDLKEASRQLNLVSDEVMELHQHPQIEGYCLPTLLTTELLALAIRLQDRRRLPALLDSAQQSPVSTPSYDWPLAALDLQCARAYAYLQQREAAKALMHSAQRRLKRHAAYFHTQEGRERFVTAFATHRALCSRAATAQ